MHPKAGVQTQAAREVRAEVPSKRVQEERQNRQNTIRSVKGWILNYGEGEERCNYAAVFNVASGKRQRIRTRWKGIFGGKNGAMGLKHQAERNSHGEV